MINDLYPLKAQYDETEPVSILIEMDPSTVSLNWVLSHLEQIIQIGSLSVEMGQTKTCLEFAPLMAGGYGLTIQSCDQNGHQRSASTAFAVFNPKNERHILRYGFLSDFSSQDLDQDDLAELAKFHINMIQFYDWSYRPHDHIPATTEFSDLMGKENRYDVIRHKIESARRLGMRSIAYGAVYAAGNEFLAQHPDWGLLDHSGQQIRFIEKFCIMDISRACPWHDHIIDQYALAIRDAGFDGIHMDTYGHPKWGVSSSNHNQTLYLEDHLPELINDTRQHLSEIRDDVLLVFNNVGNWPVERTASAQQDCVYIEVWPPYDRYLHIRQLILDAKHHSGGKPVILAAYLAPFRTGSASGALYASLILTAIIQASGGTHLLMGEKDGVLTQGYYADHSFLNPEQKRAIRPYYDFGVRYQDLLYDDTLIDVGMTHSGWDNVEYQCTGTAWSANAEAGKLFVICRQKPGLHVLSLINLSGLSHDFWNQDQKAPTPLSNLSFTVMLDGMCESVWMASPDQQGDSVQLIFETFHDSQGLFVRFQVPSIGIWSMIVIKCFSPDS